MWNWRGGFQFPAVEFFAKIVALLGNISPLVTETAGFHVCGAAGCDRVVDFWLFYLGTVGGKFSDKELAFFYTTG